MTRPARKSGFSIEAWLRDLEKLNARTKHYDLSLPEWVLEGR